MASGDLFRAFTVRFSFKREQHVRMLQKFEDRKLTDGKAKNQVVMDALEMYFDALENNNDTKEDKWVTKEFIEDEVTDISGMPDVTDKELTEVIEENVIVYRLAENGCYYPDLRLPEGTHYNIGKYGLIRWEYLQTNCRGEYLRLLLDGILNEYLHEMDEECRARVELFVEQMKAGAGITEKLKAANQMKWVELMNNVRITAEEIVQREMIYV